MGRSHIAAALGTCALLTATATGAPTVSIQGVPAEGRPMRALATGGKVQAVRWVRCERRACARARVIGTDTGYRLTARETRTYVQAQVRMRVRQGARTRIRTIRSIWVGPIRPRTAPTTAPTRPATPSTPMSPVAGSDPRAPITLGTPTPVRGEGEVRWTVSVLGYTADATDFVQMVDADAPRVGAGERYVMARIRMANATGARQEASATGLRLALGTETYTIAAVAEPERLATRTVDGGDAIEGTVYWRIPDTGTPTLVAAFATAPEWWRYFALV